MPRKHWRDFPPWLKNKMNAKDKKSLEDTLARWQADREHEKTEHNLTEGELIARNAAIAKDIWGTDDD